MLAYAAVCLSLVYLLLVYLLLDVSSKLFYLLDVLLSLIIVPPGAQNLRSGLWEWPGMSYFLSTFFSNQIFDRFWDGC